MKTTIKNIPDKKTKTVKELSELLKSKKTLLIASIKNIPGSQFQEIGKKLRGKAIIKVPKKNLIFRALNDSKKEELKNLKEKIEDSCALLFSNLDPYELATELIKNRTPAKAKPGQEAPIDIEIPEGPTELVPGPAISELGALGIQIQIKEGKIEIKQAKIIAKKGEKISQGAADLMGKLNIKPFSIGFIPVVALDIEKEIMYTNIEIDEEKAIESLKDAFAKALPFAVEIGYITEDTVKVMVRKAGTEERKLIRIISGEPEVVENEEETKTSQEEELKKEEKKENNTEGLASLFG